MAMHWLMQSCAQCNLKIGRALYFLQTRLLLLFREGLSVLSCAAIKRRAAEYFLGGGEVKFALGYEFYLALLSLHRSACAAVLVLCPCFCVKTLRLPSSFVL